MAAVYTLTPDLNEPRIKIKQQEHDLKRKSHFFQLVCMETDGQTSALNPGDGAQ